MNKEWSSVKPLSRHVWNTSRNTREIFPRVRKGALSFRLVMFLFIYLFDRLGPSRHIFLFLTYPWRMLKESFAANRSDMFIQSIPSHVVAFKKKLNPSAEGNCIVVWRIYLDRFPIWLFFFSLLLFHAVVVVVVDRTPSRLVRWNSRAPFLSLILDTFFPLSLFFLFSFYFVCCLVSVEAILSPELRI